MQIVHSGDVSSAEISTDTRESIQRVSEEQLRKWVQTISRPRHFTAETEANEATADWLHQTFLDLGYRVQRQGPYSNILAFPKNSFSEAILIAAHFDSVPGSPGADDNGSAVAAMLETAKICHGASTPVPVIFAGFNREEDGLVGSSDFVEKYLPDANFKIRCAHILEMVGFSSGAPGSQRLPTGLPIQLRDAGDFLGLLSNDASAKIMKSTIRMGRGAVPDLPITGLQVVAGAEHFFPVLARSDHVPFWRKEIPAMMWTDTAEFRNPHYHRESDTPDTLNYSFLRRVTQVLTATVLSPH